EDAEDRVAIEVDALGVAADLLVGGGVAEAQVAVGGVQREQVLRDLDAVAVVQRADGHRGGVGTGVARRLGNGLGHRGSLGGGESHKLGTPGGRPQARRPAPAQSGSAVVLLTRSITKLVLQSCTLGCLSRVSIMKRE